MTVGAVAVSGAVAYAEGHWRRRPGLDLGFADHGGMWGDALLLPVANGVIVPWLPAAWWLTLPVLLAAGAAALLHAAWHGGTRGGFRDHMWPTRPASHWARDLSWAGWCHMAYVTGQIAILVAYAVTTVPPAVVLMVTIVLTLHVPLGLLHPSWSATGTVPRANLRLLAAAIVAAWMVGVGKGL
ncbi:MAG: hypothetical protein R2712_11500 [Vicinamibacterales bacterium]